MLKQLKSNDMDCGCCMYIDVQAQPGAPQTEFSMCHVHHAGPDFLLALKNIRHYNSNFGMVRGQLSAVMKRNYESANEALVNIEPAETSDVEDQRVSALEGRMQGIEAGIEALTDSLQELLGERQLALDAKETEYKRRMNLLAAKEAEIAAIQHGGCVQVIPKSDEDSTGFDEENPDDVYENEK